MASLTHFIFLNLDISSYCFMLTSPTQDAEHAPNTRRVTPRLRNTVA